MRNKQYRELRSVLCGDLEGWDGGGSEAEEGGTHVADSLCHAAETNTILQSKSPPT